MKLTSVCGGLVLLATGVLGPVAGAPTVLAVAQERGPSTALASEQELVDEYCLSCHDDDIRLGGFSFTDLDLVHPAGTAPLAEKLIRKLRSGMMPPVGVPRPDAATLKAFASALETRIDRGCG